MGPACTGTSLIPAIDLGLVALVQCTVVVLPLGIRGIRTIQFTLASFLLFVVVFASILAFLTRVATATWFEWPTSFWYGVGISWFGIGYALLTLLAARIAGRQGRWGWRWLFVIAIPYVALVVVWLRTVRRWSVERNARIWRVALSVLSLLTFSPVLSAFVFLLFFRSPIPEEVPPAENCLVALCDAGASIPASLFRPFPKSNQALTAAVSQSAESLRRARSAMTTPGWLDVNYYELKNLGLPGWKNRIPQRDSLVPLSNAFLAEGNLALRQGRIDDALMSYRDIFHLARCSGRGGLPLDARLVAEFEDKAIGRVHANCQSMNRKQCLSWIEVLSRQESALESTDILMRRRYAWVDRVVRWQDRLLLWYTNRIGLSKLELDLDIYERLRPTQFRLLATELAARAFHLDHGRYPESLEELVPELLAIVPRDPFGSSNLVYRVNEKTFSLYSIGPDGKDDGGVFPANWSWFGKGDITPDFLKRLDTLETWSALITLETLAAACAVDGDFDRAVKWQTKAIGIAPDHRKADLGSLLELYKSGKPYRQPPRQAE